MKIIFLITLSLIIQSIFPITLDQVLTNLKVLEEYTKEYKSKGRTGFPFNHLLLAYIRSQQYTGRAWDYAGGTLPKDFATFINNKDKEKGTRAHECPKYGEIELPSKEKMKFAHMFATMNGIEKGHSFTGGFSTIAGWGGDTVQLAGDIKNSRGNLDQLIVEASNFIGKKGKFCASSLISDLDAPIIFKKKTNSNSFTDIIRNYYNGNEWKNRASNFVKITFPEANKNNLRDIIYKRHKKDFYVGMLIDKRGLTGYSTHVQAAAYAFADYLKKHLN
jgi:hypothetical protein